MAFSLISLIYFIAFSQAVLIATALWKQSSNGQSGRILSVLIMIFGYKMYEAGVMHSDFYKVVPHTLDWLPGVVLIIGPVFYAYIRLVSGEKAFTVSQWLLHLLPAVLLIIYNSPQVFVSAETKIAKLEFALNYQGTSRLPYQVIALLIALKLHLAIYLAKSWQILKQFEQKVNQLRADNSKTVLRRQKQLCLALIALEAVWILLFVLQQVSDVYLLNYVSNSWLLFMAMIILTMGYYGLKQPNMMFTNSEQALIHSQWLDKLKDGITEIGKATKQIKVKNTSNEHRKNNDNVVQIEKQQKNEKYQLSKLSQAAALEIATMIDHVMLEKELYLDDKLTLTALSNELNLKPHMVSQVINQSMHLNFYQLVNRYRVEFAIKLLNEEQTNWSLERIAFESGFGNRVTFNSAFKTFKGCSPSAFKKQLKKAI
ncbi:MAG: helix-turn-helix domain-containing protein [Kangiellaceae bacterium]